MLVQFWPPVVFIYFPFDKDAGTGVPRPRFRIFIENQELEKICPRSHTVKAEIHVQLYNGKCGYSTTHKHLYCTLWFTAALTSVFLEIIRPV